MGYNLNDTESSLVQNLDVANDYYRRNTRIIRTEKFSSREQTDDNFPQKLSSDLFSDEEFNHLLSLNGGRKESKNSSTKGITSFNSKDIQSVSPVQEIKKKYKRVKSHNYGVNQTQPQSQIVPYQAEEVTKEEPKKEALSRKFCYKLIKKKQATDKQECSVKSTIKETPKIQRSDLLKSEIVSIIMNNESSAHLLKSFFQKIRYRIKYQKYVNIAHFITSDNFHVIALKTPRLEEVGQIVMKCTNISNSKEFYQVILVKELYPMKESIEVNKLASNYRFLKSILSIDKGKIRINKPNNDISKDQSKVNSQDDLSDGLTNEHRKSKILTKSIDLKKTNSSSLAFNNGISNTNNNKARYSIYTNQTITKDMNQEASISLEGNEIYTKALNDLDLSRLKLSHMKEQDSNPSINKKSSRFFDTSNIINNTQVESNYEKQNSKCQQIKHQFNQILKSRISNIGYTNQEELLKDISIDSIYSSQNED